MDRGQQAETARIVKRVNVESWRAIGDEVLRRTDVGRGASTHMIKVYGGSARRRVGSGYVIRNARDIPFLIPSVYLILLFYLPASETTT